MSGDFDVEGFSVALGEYVLRCVPSGLPSTYESLVRHAQLSDAIDLAGPDRCCIALSRANDPWPFLVVAQSFAPDGMGFEPGVLLAPETERLFVGAGERLLAYDLAAPKRIWIDAADTGFWSWARHGDVVLMSAECELAAWTATGEKLWNTFVEPPWTYRVQDGEVLLDVMSRESRFDVRRGPG